jgi:hypothetical protein
MPDNMVRWIVRDLIPASQRIMVVGKGGSYKSTLVFDLCVAIGSGGLLLKYLPVEAPGPVLLVSTEGSVFTNKDRLVMHMRGDDVHPGNLQLEFCQQAFLLDDPREHQELLQKIHDVRPALVVMDPLDSFYSGDENSAQETKAFRRFCDHIIDVYQCSVLVIHHVGKGDKIDPRGSSAWFDWADTVIAHEKKKKKVKVGKEIEFTMAKVTVTKQRNGVEGHVFTIIPQVDPEWGQITFDFWDEGASGRVAQRFLQKEVYKLLRAGGPQTNQMLEESCTFGRDKLRGVLAELEEMGLANREGVVTTSVTGRAPKNVSGWQALRPATPVDAAISILRAMQLWYAEDAPLKEVPRSEDVAPPI